MKLHHIERLMNGKSSGIKIGSRAVPHHLQLHEKAQYTLALKHGYVHIHTRSRVNILNIWQKVCLAHNWPYIVVLQEYGTSSAIVYIDQVQKKQCELKEAKKYAREYFLTHSHE